jgi:hypothetical protein
MNGNDLRVSVLLGIQVALLGHISSRVRRVLCRWDDQEIRARAIFDGNVTEEDAEAISEAETEMMANFPHHVVSIAFERCDAPNAIIQIEGECAVYSRFEQ